MRARPPINVAEIAAQFGGGGHALAAGCTLEPPLEQAIDRMYQAINKSLNSIII
ncbi:MAG: hypothetical protein LBS72_06355 [Oscillospiraceae bacterium]|nr:hypothetical protein [Oscillospiraceae bacterium]